MRSTTLSFTILKPSSESWRADWAFFTNFGHLKLNDLTVYKEFNHFHSQQTCRRRIMQQRFRFKPWENASSTNKFKHIQVSRTLAHMTPYMLRLHSCDCLLHQSCTMWQRQYWSHKGNECRDPNVPQRGVRANAPTVTEISRYADVSASIRSSAAAVWLRRENLNILWIISHPHPPT